MQTKQSVDQVTRDLIRRNLSAQAIHGDRSQQSRLETLNAFKDGSLRVLVATDIAARGLDIAELPFVINYEMPAQPEDYVHRIGRTGRAGADGVAISLMDESEQKMFEAIKELTGNKLLIERIEGFEPRWWEQEGSKPEKTETSEPRQRNRYESAKAQREKNTRPETTANDAVPHAKNRRSQPPQPSGTPAVRPAPTPLRRKINRLKTECRLNISVSDGIFQANCFICAKSSG